MLRRLLTLALSAFALILPWSPPASVATAHVRRPHETIVQKAAPRPTTDLRPSPGRRRLAAIPAYPTIVESHRAIVILLGFSDRPSGSLTVQTAENLYFGPSGSVAQYFAQQSRNQFLLTGDVIGGAAVGQTTQDLVLPHSAAYYTSFGPDNGDTKMSLDAMALLDAKGFNWAPYEDSQGQIDQMVYLFSEPDATSINSPFYSVEVQGGLSTKSGVQVSGEDYVSQEDPLGILTHEFGHLLNFDDTYDVNVFNEPASATGCVTGAWDLYDQGLYNGPNLDGSQPSPIDPYQLIYAGWIHPTVLTSAGTYTLPPIETSGQVDEISFPNSTEVYLLENVEPVGYDAQLPGFGMLVWKVDTSIANPTSTYWINDTINEQSVAGAPPHAGIQVVTAGNENIATTCGSSSDPFPGSDHVTTFSDKTTPSAVLDGNIPSNIALQGIQTNGQSVTFTLAMTGVTTALVTGPTSPIVGVPNTYTVVETLASGAVGGSASFTVTSPWGDPSGTLANGSASFTLTPPASGSGTLSVTLSDQTVVPLLSLSAVTALPYTDVAPSFWGQPSIQAFYTEGLFTGIPGWTGTTFSPNAPVTRAEFVALLLHGLGIHQTTPAVFSDVSANFWASGEIGEAAALGLVNGTGNGMFSPNATLTRGAISTLLARAFGLSDNAQRFSFADALPGAWYYQPMTLMWQAGYLKGLSSTQMAPQGSTTRAQATTILLRILQSGAKTTVSPHATPHR